MSYEKFESGEYGQIWLRSRLSIIAIIYLTCFQVAGSLQESLWLILFQARVYGASIRAIRKTHQGETTLAEKRSGTTKYSESLPTAVDCPHNFSRPHSTSIVYNSLESPALKRASLRGQVA